MKYIYICINITCVYIHIVYGILYILQCMLYVVYISINLISISRHIHIQNTLRNSAWEGATQPSELVDAMSQMLEADVGRFLCLVWEFRGKLIRIAHEKWRIHWNLMDFWVELMVWVYSNGPFLNPALGLGWWTIHLLIISIQKIMLNHQIWGYAFSDKTKWFI